MKLIVGLGNPGKEYDNTRHNIGFMYVDSYIINKFSSVDWKKKFNGLYYETINNGEKTIFVKPQSYMNLSGEVVSQFVNYYKIDVNDILVISDDMDLLTGNFKLKDKGSCGGHNGLRNIEKCIGTAEYKRLKIGISKNNNIDSKDYVLGKFSNEDKNIYKELFNELNEVIDDFNLLPYGDLMSKHNRKNK